MQTVLVRSCALCDGLLPVCVLLNLKNVSIVTFSLQCSSVGCLKYVVYLWKHLNTVLQNGPSLYSRDLRFLAECCKRQLNQGSFVLLYFRLFTFSDLHCVCLSVFSCTVLFVSISQVIGCEDRLRNDLYCVEWGVKLYSNQPSTKISNDYLRGSNRECNLFMQYVAYD